MELRGFANLESVRRFAAFLPPAADILVAVATICLPLRGISRGAAPYLYTQSVCAACFASILGVWAAVWRFPFGNFPLYGKHKSAKNKNFY